MSVGLTRASSSCRVNLKPERTDCLVRVTGTNNSGANSDTSEFSDYPLFALGLSELYNKVGKIKLSDEYIQKGIISCKKNREGDYYLPYFISNQGKNYFKKKQFLS